jgi:hypothetical protein
MVKNVIKIPSQYIFFVYIAVDSDRHIRWTPVLLIYYEFVTRSSFMGHIKNSELFDSINVT